MVNVLDTLTKSKVELGKNLTLDKLLYFPAAMYSLTLTVPVTTIDALQHFETG